MRKHKNHELETLGQHEGFVMGELKPQMYSLEAAFIYFWPIVGSGAAQRGKRQMTSNVTINNRLCVRPQFPSNTSSRYRANTQYVASNIWSFKPKHVSSV